MNSAKLKEAIGIYFHHFYEPKEWLKERSKWTLPVTFLNNFDIDAADFSATLDKAIGEIDHIVSSNHFYPVHELKNQCGYAQDSVRKAFRALFDNGRSLKDRVNTYVSLISGTRQNSKNFVSKDGYDPRFVSVLLFLKFPNEYTIFKETEFKDFNHNFDCGFDFNPHRHVADKITSAKQLAEMIAAFVSEFFPEEVKHYQKFIRDQVGCYEDPDLLILSNDILWCTSREKTLSDNQKESDIVLHHGTLHESHYQPTLLEESGLHTDYLAKAKRQQGLGELGESFVVSIEKEALKSTSFKDKVIWASRDNGDGLGYDVLSYELSGEPKYIEVKTTTGPEETDFEITATELAACRKYGDRYYLYRVYNYGSDREAISYYQGKEVEALCNTPSVYTVRGQKKHA
jgi:hypothetical protein